MGIVSFIHAQLANPLLSGGIVLMFTGAFMALLREMPNKLYFWIKEQLAVDIVVMNSDPLFDYFSIWLHNHPYTGRARRLVATTQGDALNETDAALRVVYSPGPGTHFLRYRRHLIWLTRNKEDGKAPAVTSGANLRREESYTIRVLGRHQDVARSLVRDVLESARAEQRKKISAFISVFGWWSRLGSYLPRAMGSVVLPAGVSEGLLTDIREFLEDRDWYGRMGIPWHRGYLLHGSPGTGKTSLIAAVAGELKMDLYVMNIAGNGMGDERLAELMRDVRPNSILLMEDVDAAVVNREPTKKEENKEEKDDEAKGVSLSGLLNCLDGITSKDGGVVFMTTNHRDRLDPALTRPGRIDREIMFGAATEDQVARLYERFFPHDGTRHVEVYAHVHRGRMMAEIQQDLMARRSRRNKEQEMTACP